MKGDLIFLAQVGELRRQVHREKARRQLARAAVTAFFDGCRRFSCPYDPSGTAMAAHAQLVLARPTVGFMPLQITASLVVPDAELSWRFSRSSGPGGQGVNTTDSRVELTVDLSQVLSPYLLARAVERLGGATVTVSASEQRSQLQNRQAAAERLADIVRAAIAPPPAPRRPTRPTRSSKERRLEGKRQRSDLKRTRRDRGDHS